MHRCADTADALRPDPCFARVTAPQNQFDAAKHRARAPGVCHRASVHLSLNTQVTFDTSDGIDYNARHKPSLLAFARGT